MSWVSALVDIDTLRVLVFSPDPGSLNLIHFSDGSTMVRSFAETALIGDKLQFKNFSGTVPPDTWIEFVAESETLVHRPELPLISQALRDKSTLYRSKHRVLQLINDSVNCSRRRIKPPEVYGELVGGIKRAQAVELKKSGFDPNKIGDCLFVLQYGEVHGLTIEQAADQIILEAEFWEAEIWKSEGLKMKYWKLVLETRDVSAMDDIATEFKREFFVNAFI